MLPNRYIDYVMEGVKMSIEKLLELWKVPDEYKRMAIAFWIMGEKSAYANMMDIANSLKIQADNKITVMNDEE